MQEDSNPVDSDSNPSRRRFLRAAGGLTSAALTAPFLTGAGGADSGPAPEKFRVSGHQIVKARIRPDEVVLEKRKIAPELRQRYGISPPVLTKTETIQRQRPEADDLPRRDVRTHKHEWDTYYAKEEEWHEVLTAPKAAGFSASAEPSVETDYPYGVWQYEEVDGGYEISSPMNVIASESIGDLKPVFDDDGWSTGWIAEYTRYAWNSDTEQFESNHDSVANSAFGFLGRNHARMWEFGDHTSMSAHVDSSVPHSATSYLEAEREIEDVFDDASGWWGFQDYYDLPNCCKMDHNGHATRPYSW